MLGWQCPVPPPLFGTHLHVQTLVITLMADTQQDLQQYGLGSMAAESALTELLSCILGKWSLIRGWMIYLVAIVGQPLA